jgi:hypothetical protein
MLVRLPPAVALLIIFLLGVTVTACGSRARRSGGPPATPAPQVDAGGRDGGVSGGSDAGGGRDGGVTEPTDARPGGDGGSDAGCNVSGTYTVVLAATNPELCALTELHTCTVVQSSPTLVTLECGTTTATCTLDTSCRFCTGTTTVFDLPATISIDYVARTGNVTSDFGICEFSFSRG